MKILTIHNLDQWIASRLKKRAADHGHSVEEEVLEILRNALSEFSSSEYLSECQFSENEITKLFAPIGGVELSPFPRDQIHEPPNFEGCGMVIINPWE